MTPTDIAAIEARLSAATPGPWFHDLQFLQVAAPDPRGGSCRYITAEGGPTDPDADFIANAPTDIADLLAEVRRLTARVAEVEAEREDAALERDGAYEDVARLMCEHAAEIAAGQRQIDHVDRERDALLTRVAELEEAARWRHYPDVEPPDRVEIEAVINADGARVIGRWIASISELSSLARGWDGRPFYWRPLGPGPVAP